MALAPIFSTYRQGENRVTGALMAVLARLPLQASEQVIGEVLDANIPLVSFLQLPGTEGTGNPDGRIKANIDILTEIRQ